MFCHGMEKAAIRQPFSKLNAGSSLLMDWTTEYGKGVQGAEPHAS